MTNCRTISIRGAMSELEIPGTWDDTACIRETLNGNKNAFGILVERYQHQSVRIAYSIVGNIETARDLSQEAFIKAYRSLNLFNIQAPFLPWFYRILRNVCFDHLRKRKRAWQFQEQFREKFDDHADLRDEIHARDVAEKVRDAVKKLSARDREIIELKHFAGLSYAEIADVLSIPVGTVMSRLFYARKELKHKLQRTLDYLDGADR